MSNRCATFRHTHEWQPSIDPRYFVCSCGATCHKSALTSAAPDAPLVECQNPMVVLYGAGPEGVSCAGCAKLVRVYSGASTFFKCRLRGLTHSKATDHRMRDPACSKYVAREAAEIETRYTR